MTLLKVRKQSSTKPQSNFGSMKCLFLITILKHLQQKVLDKDKQTFLVTLIWGGYSQVCKCMDN